MRYFIYISYNGTNYHGWQMQPNAVTVQDTIQKAMSVILAKEIQITGAGRTDTGVHAKTMVAHFDWNDTLDTDSLVKRLNSLLPSDIAIKAIVEVAPEAHARFSAISRTYEYRLYFDKNPFLKGLAYRHYRELDFEAMNMAAAQMRRYRDFTSFSKLHTDTLTNNCNVLKTQWQQQDNVWVFTIQADRFLRDMVRATVGTLIMVGEHRITVDDFCNIIEAKDRQKAGHSIDACGLYLSNVEYPNDIFLNNQIIIH